MAELFQKRKITHLRKKSAQSERLQQRYCRFYWFLKIACLRYVSTWGRDCVSGVLPCLVHSQNLSKLIGHSDDGQKPNRTAVCVYLNLFHHVAIYSNFKIFFSTLKHMVNYCEMRKRPAKKSVPIAFCRS